MSKRAEALRQQNRREKEFEAVLEANFKKVQNQAIAAGGYAMCKVILDKAKADGKTEGERLQDITEFCEICIRNRDEERDALKKETEAKSKIIVPESGIIV